MHCPLLAFAVLGAVALVDALVLSPAVADKQALDLLEETANPGQELDLLEKRVFGEKKQEKKWNWKEASEESKTEWAIVLKRYVLIDMTLYELGRFFGEVVSTAEASSDRGEVLDKARVKLARLQSNLERAVLDQNTSDATAGDMQKDRKGNKLTVHQKRTLADEHKREQYGFFAIEASGQDVLEKANELFQALDVTPVQMKKASPSWSSIVEAPATPAIPKPTYMSMLNATVVELNATVVEPNATLSNATALRGSKPTVAMLSQRFEAASATFHGDLGRFESMQSKAITNLLTIE